MCQPIVLFKTTDPVRVAVDATDVYVADFTGNRISQIDRETVLQIRRETVILAIAGTGTAGYSGDGGLATEARLNGPYGMALDAAGNLYVSDRNNNRIRRIDRDGIITTVAGTGVPGFSGDGGPATAAKLNSPIGLAVDAAGSLYIADGGNNRVRRVDADGVITTVAGGGG